MSLALCYNCGALIDTDFEPEAYVRTDENGDETYEDEPQCSSCTDGSY